MPKLIDYAARFDLIREAVYEITLRDGPAGISLPAVACQLHTSVSSLRRVLRSADALPLLGLQWIERQQRRRTFDHWADALRGPEPVLRPVNTLLRQLPRTTEMADQDRAWSALVDTFDHDQTWAQQAREDRDVAIDGLCDTIVGTLGLDEHDALHEFEVLRAIVEGVTVLIRRRRLAPEIGTELVHRHLLELLGDRARLSDGDVA